jgi:hypothetical protein
MSKLFKNSTALIIAISLFLQLFPIQVEAAGYNTSEKYFEATGGKVYYTLDDESATIVGCDDSVTAVVIPVTLEGKPVTAIGEMAFAQPPAHTPDNPCLLESICFGDGSQVTSIGKQAFYGCQSLVNVTLPESLLSIEERAFGCCYVLTSITIPESLTSIGDGAFSYCYKLATVTISEDSSLTSIGEEAFYVCNALESIALPALLESMGYASFKYCIELESVDMTNLTLLKNIPAEAFNGCSELTEVTIPTCVETIGGGAFSDCTKLGTVTLQEGLTSIDNAAFSRTAIESIVLPDSLTNIGWNAFARCEKLQTVDWPNNSGFTEVTGFNECTALTDDFIETLPSSVNRIGEDAFYNCTFTDVTIPAHIESVGEYAFGGIIASSEQPLVLRFVNPDISFRDEHGDLERICGSTYYADLYGAAGSDVEDYVDTYNGVQYSQYGYYTYRFFLITDVPQSHTVSIAVPDTAAVEIARNGVTVETTETSAEGTKTFDATVLEGADITVKVSLENHYDKHFIKKAAAFTGDWGIGTLTSSDFDAVPVDGRMYAELSRSDTGLLLGSFDGLTFTLKNGATTLKEGAEKDYTIQYPNIIVADGINSDAQLTFTVTPDDSMKLSPATTTGTKRGGKFILELPAWGKVFVTTTSSFAGDNNVLFFDNAGKLIENGVTDVASYSSGPLKSGSYTVVAFNANNRLNAVSTLASLGEIGLTENKDYVKSSIIVADKTTTQISLTVPLLNLSTSESITNSDGCYVTVEKSSVICGQPFNVRVFYSLKEQPEEGATITVTLPKDASVTNVSDELSILPGVTPSDNKLTITTTKQKGVLYIFGVSVPIENAGTNNICASIRVGGLTAPLGSASFDAIPLKMEVPEEWLSQLGGSVTVYSEPNTDVSLYVGSNPAPVAGRTNAAGRTVINYTLPEDTIAGQAFSLRSQVTTHKVDDKVIYSLGDTTLMELSFVHAGRQYYVVANGQTSHTYYTYVATGDEVNKYWSFSAKFESSDMKDNNVTLLISMMDGSVRTEPMTLIRTKDLGGGKKEYQYAAEVFIEQAGNHIFSPSLVPNGFGIEYDFDAVEFELDVVYVTSRAQEKTDERNRITEEGRGEDTTDLSDLIFNKEYIVSDEDWFGTVPSDGQQVIYEAEKAVEGTLEAISDVFGLPKDITEYDGWTDVFGDMGAEYSDYSSADPSQLASDGYTVSDDGSLAVKMKTETQPDGSLSETGFSVVDVTAGKAMDVNYSIDAWENASYTGFGLSINGLDSATERFGKWVLDNPLGSSADEVAKAAGNIKKLNTAVKVVGPVVSGLVAAKNSYDYIDAVVATEEMKGYVENLKIYENYYKQNGNDPCWMAVLEELRIAKMLLGYLEGQQRNTASDSVVGAISTVGTVIGYFTGGTGAAVVSGASTLYDTGSAAITLQRSRVIEDLKRQLNRAHQDRMNECGNLKSKNSRMRTLKPKLDPSGIVYEALETNPLTGVTATIYTADDVNGTNAAPWTDASAYDEVNPQTTGADGAYAWDVPPGWWQVRFTKAGYTPAQTVWMQVPPPRMNLVTPMLSTSAPTVLSANAYSDYIELVFSQYMDTTADLTLPDGMTGTWQSVEESLSKVLKIEKDGGFEGTVSFTLTGAKNYAGTGLGVYNSGNLTVSTRPAEILLNYETTIPMKAGETPNVTVRVKDADGNHMSGVTVDAVIANTLLADIDLSTVTDNDGKAVFNAEALLPGLTTATFTVRGTSVSKTASVRVTVDANRPARPTALVGGTSITAASPKENYVTVQPGANLTLSAEPDVAIFYTTDDTCPCQNSSSRRIYTAPITLNANVKYRIAAYIDGKAYSERLNITVTVSSGDNPPPPPPAFVPIVIPNPAITIGSGESYSFSNLEKLVSENKSLTVENSEGAKLVFDTDALKGIMSQTSGSIKVELSDVSDEYQETYPDKLVFSLTVTSGDKAISNFGGSVTVSLPYELKEGEKPENVKVWYLAADGSMTEIPCTYDPTTKKVSFIVTHFSLYIVGIDSAQLNPFTDVNEDDWFYNAVSFFYENGLMTGTGDMTFSPSANTSRGMIVTILWRLENKPNSEKPTTFTDVAEGKWYYDAVAWAAEKGIVDGYSKDKFGPEDCITREQMSKILCSYAAYKSYDVSARGDLSVFIDSPSGWALEYMQWAVAEGLLQGKGNNLLDPRGNTKRSECAAILQRFIEKHTL